MHDWMFMLSLIWHSDCIWGCKYRISIRVGWHWNGRWYYQRFGCWFELLSILCDFSDSHSPVNTIIPYKDEEDGKDEDENDNDIHILECHVSHPLAFS